MVPLRRGGSPAPHIIETVPLENRRQVGTLDS
jgi:hypothetical protein